MAEKNVDVSVINESNYQSKLCTFIILNYNDFQTSITLVDQLVNYLQVQKVILVDNNSSDDSFNVLSNKYKTIQKVVVLKSDKNGGYSYGNNIGIDYFFENKIGSDFVVISNPDIYISEESLNQLMSSIEKNRKIGMIAPMMNISGENIFKISCWKQPTYFYDFLSSVPFFRRYAEKIIRYKKNYFDNDLIEVDVLPGSFMMFPKKVLADGLRFDDRFFLFCEERIICEKIRKIGLKVVLYSKLKYEHYESVSIKKSFSKVIQRQKLLNDSKKKYYEFYKQKNKIRNRVLFFSMDLCFVLQKLIYKFKGK